MADEATFNEIVGLIGKLADKLESISGQLEGMNTLERIKILEGRIDLIEKAVIGLADLRTRMSKIEEAINKNTEGLKANTCSVDKCFEKMDRNFEQHE
jgi:hypothetical protein